MKTYFKYWIISTLLAVISCKTYAADIYCSPDGNGDGSSVNSPTKIENAINSIKPGETIYLLKGTYNLTSTIIIEENNNGESGKMKTIKPYNNEKVVLDFSEMETSATNRGFVVDGDYWHFYGFEISGAGDNGMLLSGNNNIIELMLFSNNQDTGLQISRYKTSNTTIASWPSNNLVLNCTSRNNCDDATMENADGFAAKLTCGEGNIFDGCFAYNNSDDGWDLYAKEATGPIGVVTIKNSVAFRNGYTEDGRGYGDCDGNGFKLGGGGIGSAHVVENCLAFENLHCGYTDNNNPELKSIKNCTAVNNDFGGDGKPNFSVYRCTNCNFENLVSYYCNNVINKMSNDKYVGSYTNGVYYNSGYYQVTEKTSVSNGSKIGTKISEPASSNFISTTVKGMGTDFHSIWRNSDGTPNLGGLYETKNSSEYASMGYHFENISIPNPEEPSEPENPSEEDPSDNNNVEITDTDLICYFTNKTPSSTRFYTFSNASYSNSKGEETINGVKYSDCLKMESQTQISFSTTEKAKLTIVFGTTETPSIKVNGNSISNIENVSLSENVLVIEELAAGDYILSKENSVNIYYIAITYYGEETDITIPVNEISELSGDIFDLWGRIVDKNRIEKNKIYFQNGRKIIIRN